MFLLFALTSIIASPVDKPWCFREDRRMINLPFPDHIGIDTNMDHCTAVCKDHYDLTFAAFSLMQVSFTLIIYLFFFSQRAFVST